MNDENKNRTVSIMFKRKTQNKSPLLDAYIQKQNQSLMFENVEDKEIAKAIRTLIHKDESIPKNLN